MRLHLVGGFLGGGKTTAIVGASKRLMSRGARVGVVTNDQGRYLVDTAFVSSARVPAVEVTGGCFCCHYDDLEARLDELERTAMPHAIFAESVGSCADLVATVIKPLADLKRISTELTTFSVFTDIRLLKRRLEDQPMPFSENVVYIFDKQIEEAGLLILNKADLLDPEEARRVERMARARYPSKAVRLQNSLDDGAIDTWLWLLETKEGAASTGAIEIDYQRYGAGEAELAWLDQKIRLAAPQGRLREAVVALIGGLLDGIREHRLPIGHVKFLVRCGDEEVKIGATASDDAAWRDEVPPIFGKDVTVVVNARVQTDATLLGELARAALEQAQSQTGARCLELTTDFFHPGFPRPTHRME
jgi:Ni2+-binding GTPase involved in maturation of urease and hydrogenase